MGDRFGAPSELERFNLGARIRDIKQGPDGSIWLVMDPDNSGKRWSGGILKLTPAEKLVCPLAPAAVIPTAASTGPTGNRYGFLIT